MNINYSTNNKLARSAGKSEYMSLLVPAESLTTTESKDRKQRAICAVAYAGLDFSCKHMRKCTFVREHYENKPIQIY